MAFTIFSMVALSTVLHFCFFHPASDFLIGKRRQRHEDAHQDDTDSSRQVIQPQRSSNPLSQHKGDDEDASQHAQNKPSVGRLNRSFGLQQKKEASNSVHSLFQSLTFACVDREIQPWK
jgi:hypothetical protein